MYFKQVESDILYSIAHNQVHKKLAAERRRRNALLRHMSAKKPEAAFNRKKGAKLAARIADYERMCADVKFNAPLGAVHRPGSFK